MSKFPVVIIDDLNGALEDTAAILEELGLFNIVGKFTSVSDAEHHFLKVDEKAYIIFCDIEMPECSGIDAVKLLRNYCSYFVFITGYAQEYALKGYELHVDGFLIKPIETDRLVALLKHLRTKTLTLTTPHKGYAESRILLDAVHKDSALHFAKKSAKSVRKDPFNKREYEKVPILLTEIMYVEKMKNYIHFYGLRSPDEIILLGVILGKLMDIEVNLSPHINFVRINNSRIINTDYITKVLREGVVVGPKHMPVAQSRFDAINSALGNINR